MPVEKVCVCIFIIYTYTEYLQLSQLYLEYCTQCWITLLWEGLSWSSLLLVHDLLVKSWG